MLRIDFECLCHTEWGQNVFVVIRQSGSDGFDISKATRLVCFDLNRWRISVDIELEEGHLLEYRYLMADNERNFSRWEKGDVRTYRHSSPIKGISIIDSWRNELSLHHSWNTSAFSKVIFKREVTVASKKVKTANWIELQVNCPRVFANQKLVIVGNSEVLGNWNVSKGLELSDVDFPLWNIRLNRIGLPDRLEYKYVIVQNDNINSLIWEYGSNRVVDCSRINQPGCQVFDDIFKYPNYTLKGAGVSIPVFSIRTEKSFGVGDFEDLKPMADWASEIGLRLIQVLPVNDTISTNTFLDSYPYKAISVFALHPLYLNIEKLGKFMDADLGANYKLLQNKLNASTEIDYIEVLNHKIGFARKAFEQFFDKVKSTKEYKQFYNENEDWLIPYAVFSYLRDTEGTSDFSKWKHLSTYDANEVTQLVNSKNIQYAEISFWYYIQFALYKQLKEASDYCRNKGIVLKGDIPIGISRTSVDAWSQPELYHFDGQAGAPPDDFSADGQNWGFPTYNWEVMAKDGYKWWRSRLTNMAQFFDAYRIDHILGFFRIWEIPYSAVQGILGHFRPSHTIGFDELKHKGIWFDYNRLCNPYIREQHLNSIFGNHSALIQEKYLDLFEYGEYRLKDGFKTQREIYDRLVPEQGPEVMSDEERTILNGLLRLVADVVLIPANDQQTEFYPRISMHSTNSYHELDPTQKHRLDLLYIDYFYHRHDAYWKEKAMEKLPVLVNATNMLVCGEDLGMIPTSVPQVMRDLGVLSLEIQRMPKDPKQTFAHPADAPYLSVCTTSTHDMSSIRGWWEEDRAQTQKFYNQQLGQWGDMPFYAEPWVCKLMIEQHLYSDAMWTIFPIQDLIAMSPELRVENPHTERINEPANPRHYWRYRLHLSIEKLRKATGFNTLLKNLVEQSGRKIA